jgi:hypothetical protein
VLGMRSRNFTSSCNRCPGLRLLVALPALAIRPVLLIRRKPRHAVPRQDAMHRRHRDSDLVEPLQVGRDPARHEVVVLAQVEDDRVPWT